MQRRILLVDDELPVLLTLKAVLEMNGFHVETAASVAEAERKITGEVFDMVITDLRMGSETAGHEVIRAARAQSYNPATAILTAFPNAAREWQSSGAQSLFVKPVNTSDLLRQIEALLVTHQDEKMRLAKSGANRGF